MKTMFKAIGLTAAAVLLVGCSQMFVAAQGDQKNVSSIDGVWQTVVTPRICASGAPLGPTFPGILLFSRDGTMTGTSTAVTSTYGLWRSEQGSRQHSFAALSLKYDASGNLVGSRQISQEVELDETGTSFTSTGGFQDYDLAGNPTIAGCSTSTGTRFQ